MDFSRQSMSGLKWCSHDMPRMASYSLSGSDTKSNESVYEPMVSLAAFTAQPLRLVLPSASVTRSGWGSAEVAMRCFLTNEARTKLPVAPLSSKMTAG